MSVSEIELVGGLKAKVDTYNLRRLSKYRWYAHRSKGSLTTYAKAITKSGKTVYMHRLVCPPPRGMVTDHVDRDGLNNVRENLRSVSPAENSSSWQESIQWRAFEAGRSGMPWDVFLEAERARARREMDEAQKSFAALNGTQTETQV